MNPPIVPMEICPVAPTGVSAYTDQISGMVLWSVLWLFGIAALVSVGAISSDAPRTPAPLEGRHHRPGYVLVSPWC
jgi:hypothetical protein